MRRLPIYFIIDVSESMVGKPIECVENGIATIIRTLKQSPYALETTVISVIVFAGKTKKIVSMQDLYTLDRVKLPIGGGTSLGHAMDFLMMDLSLSVKKNSYEEKGDWRPLIFLFTDGNPTDDITQSAQEVEGQFLEQRDLRRDLHRRQRRHQDPQGVHSERVPPEEHRHRVL